MRKPFKHTLEKVKAGHYQVRMRAAGEVVAVLKLGGRWMLVHPRLHRSTSAGSFKQAGLAAVAYARDLDGDSVSIVPGSRLDVALKTGTPL